MIDGRGTSTHLFQRLELRFHIVSEHSHVMAAHRANIVSGAKFNALDGLTTTISSLSDCLQLSIKNDELAV